MEKKMPPWMMQKKKENDPRMDARKSVAAKRLEKLKKGK